MPIVIVTGYPCSGKTTIAKRIHKLLLADSRRIDDAPVHLICDQDEKEFNRATTYADANAEKQHRSVMRSTVQRLISKDAIVILDAPNDIKGFRYEIHCNVKLVQTNQCTVWVQAEADTVRTWNQQRRAANSGDSYPPEVLETLINRYEAPNGQNRWDKPLLCVCVDEQQTPDVTELPEDQICKAVFEGVSLPPNRSTTTQPVNAKLHDLDRVLADIATEIVRQQASGMVAVGDYVRITDPLNSNADLQFKLRRALTLPQLTRMRRQNLPRLNGTNDAVRLFVEMVDKMQENC